MVSELGNLYILRNLSFFGKQMLCFLHFVGSVTVFFQVFVAVCHVSNILCITTISDNI